MAYLIVREREQGKISPPRSGRPLKRLCRAGTGACGIPLRGDCKNEPIGMDWLLWDVFRPTSQAAEEIYP